MPKPYTRNRLAVACHLLLLLTTSLCKPSASFAQFPPHYNVMFIAIDDMNEKASVFGYPQVITPNLQRLANRGVVFKRAYCQYPLCNPSRTSLLSGWRPDSTKIFNNSTRPRSVMGPDVKFLPEYFSLYGYHTERVGKIMHGPFEDDIVWDYADSAISSDLKHAQTLSGTSKNAEPGSWWVTNLPDDSTVNGKLAVKMLQRMQLQPPQPFFLALGFTVHNPFSPSLKYWNMYGDSSVQQLLPINKNGEKNNMQGAGSANITLPNTPAGDRNDVPPVAFGGKQVLKTTEEWQNTVHAYYAEVTEMDAQLGRILDEMDRQNLWQNTVVVFWSDHGQHLGEHEGTWLKNVLFEEADRAPLVVCVPGKKHGVSTALVELVDIYPSLAEICGLPAPAGMEGSSFVKLLDNVKAPWKRAVFTQVKRGAVMGRAASTLRYRYNSWDTSGEELYDHSIDPYEYTNLVKDTAYASTLKTMRRFLKEGWTKSLPPANISKSASIDNYTSKAAHGLDAAIKVFPNPSDGNVILSFNSKHAGNVLVTVYDNAGRAVFNTASKINEGNNTIRLQLSRLAAGLYNLELKNKEINQQAKLLIEK